MGILSLSQMNHPDTEDTEKRSGILLCVLGVWVVHSASHYLPHVAVLVLLAASTRAWVIAAHLLAAIADRLRLLVALLALGNRLVLLAADALRIGRRQRFRRRLMDGRPNLP